MPSSHLILCRPLLLLPPIPPSIRVFSNESTLRMRWPKYWSFSFSIIPFKEIPGLISFRMDWLDLLAVQGTLRSLPVCQTPWAVRFIPYPLHEISFNVLLSWVNSSSAFNYHLKLPPCAMCLVARLCMTLRDPWTVIHQAPLFMGILQAIILEWVAMPCSR